MVTTSFERQDCKKKNKRKRHPKKWQNKMGSQRYYRVSTDLLQGKIKRLFGRDGKKLEWFSVNVLT